MLDVDRKFVHLIPKNVDAEIKATTVFGNKYVRSPRRRTRRATDFAAT